MPVSGAWRISYSMFSWVDSGEQNDANLYINGQQLSDETFHRTYSESGLVVSTSGRVVTVEASAGDEIEIRTTTMLGDYYRILYCAEYIAKMHSALLNYSASSTGTEGNRNGCYIFTIYKYTYM